MPRDYAKNSKNKESNAIPGWAWMLGGLTIGLFVAGLVYLNENTPRSKQELLTKAVKRTIKDAQQVVEDKKNGKEPKRPHFDFYTILPELEVAIPDQELAVKKKPIKTTTPSASSPVATGSNDSFTLQAGSFRKLDQADKLKARLALQGVIANIQTVTINDGDTWHRVRIGPTADLAQLNQTRKRLSNIGVATIVVKNKN
ncbi:MAG: SPOR domain-containing protein [Gammaproteobacteria bacterium]|nr:SPOR domain-containing protein [Gammaproteobacteria bacterium]